MFRIFDNMYQRVVGDFETREEAEKRLAELVEGDPGATLRLRILAWDTVSIRKAPSAEM